MKDFKIIFSCKKIKRQVKKLAKKISVDYNDKQPIIICILKVAVTFCSDLVRQLTIPVEIDYAKVSSYKNQTTGGEVEIIFDHTLPVKDRDVIIIEDIVDSGNTL